MDWHNLAEATRFLLVERDLVGITAAWLSALRGANIGAMQDYTVQDSQGAPLVPRLVAAGPDFPFAVGYEYQLAPHGTKSHPLRRAGRKDRESVQPVPV